MLEQIRYINTQKELYYGTQYFKSEVLPVGYRLGATRKEASQYFAQKSFFVPMSYNEYYSQLTGYSSDRYISMDLYYFYIIPALNRREFIHPYADKNNYTLFFRGVNQPSTVIKNRNGIFYSANDEIITQGDAATMCLDSGDELIIKPTIETGEGKGVALLATTSETHVLEQFKSYQGDYIVQRRLKQHSKMNALNPSSLNTMRILTYRWKDGVVRHVKNKTFLRVGNPGSVRDNVGSGGGMCQVFDDGTVNDRVIHYKSMQVDSFSALHGIKDFRIPNFPDALAFAEKIHERLAYFDFIGWDIAIDEVGNPAFLEFNVPCEIGATQQGCGPIFEDELDEIMDRLSSVKRISVSLDINIFQHGYDNIIQTAGPEYKIW